MTCDSCSNGWELDGGVCTQVCLTFDGDDCTECVTGYYVSEGECVTECPDGTKISKDETTCEDKGEEKEKDTCKNKKGGLCVE